MKRRALLFAIFHLSLTMALAQRITRTYDNVSLSDVLRELSRQTSDYTLYFLYDELEDFRITTSVHRQPVPDAIRQMISFYPIRMTVDESNPEEKKIYVECTHKTDRHLTGTIVDEQGQPVAYANVAVLNPADSTILSGGVSNESGYFAIPYEHSTVLARISYVGYKTVYRLCDHPEVGTVRMQPEAYTINGVKVTGNRRIVKSQTDRLQYIVSADEFARGLDAQELMRRVPLLEVKGEDVTIVGKSATHFLLNGREMPDNMLHSKLKSLRAEDIERIEVITIPPSKYKAESNAGYVNIVTRRDQTLGVNGSLGGSLVFKERITSVLTPALNYANRWLEVSFSGMFEQVRGRNDRTTVTTFADHKKTSDVVNRFDWLWGDANLLVKCQLLKQWTVGFLGSASSILSDATRHDTTEEWNVCTETDIHTPDNREYSLSGEVFADWLIDQNGKMLTLTYDYLNNYSEQDERLEATTDNHLLNMQTTGNNRYRIDALKADMALPFTWACVEMGLAYTDISNHSSLDIFSDTAGQWAKDHGQSNRFDYHEQTAAAYFSVQRKFCNKFSAKAGLRMEQTWTKGTLEETREANRNHYLYLFPTLHISWKPSGRTSFGLAYSKGISRPGFNDLNPFRYYQTPTSYVGGNPFLQPGLTDNVEVNFSDGRGFYAVLYESHQRDGLGLPTLFEADGTEAGVIANCFTSDKTGLYASWRRNLFSWWNMNVGGEVFYAQSHVTNAVSNLRDEHSWSGKVELSVDWFLNRSHTLVLDAYYSHYFPCVNFAGRQEKSLAYSGAHLRYTLFGDRLRLQLSVSDPFHQNISRSTNHYEDYAVYFRNDVKMRNLSLSASYHFGGNKIRRTYRQSKNTEASRAGKR